MSIVEFKNVSLTFGDNPEILRDITFSLEAGSLTFVTGTIGSGKTALLKLMSAVSASWAGEIHILGQELLATDRNQLANLRAQIGIVCEELRLLNDLSPRENLALPLHVGGFSGKELDTPISELLEWLGAHIKATRYVGSLSVGEKQLLAIARALVRSPRLVVADEPTSCLDPRQKASVLAFFSKLCGLGTTVVIATNDDHLISQHPYHSQLFLENGVLHKIEGMDLLPPSASHNIGKP